MEEQKEIIHDWEIIKYAKQLDIEKEKLGKFTISCLKHTNENGALNSHIVKTLDFKVSATEVEAFFINFCKGMQYFYEKTNISPANGIIAYNYSNTKENPKKIESFCDPVGEDAYCIFLSDKYIKDKIIILNNATVGSGKDSIKSADYIALLGLSEAYNSAQYVKYGMKVDSIEGHPFDQLVKEATDYFKTKGNPNNKIITAHTTKSLFQDTGMEFYN